MKRTELYYLIGGGVGLVAALIGAVGAPRVDLAAQPAAIVNGVAIPREALARAVVALENDSRNPVTAERETAVLERLIEEELLVQHGVELGLAETDFAARRALVQSVLALAIADRAGAAPSEDELRTFYRDNAGFFAPAPRFAASVVFFRDGADARRVATAREALARGDTAAGLGDPLTLPIPRAPLAAAEWTRFIGVATTNAAAQLTPGQITAPIAAPGGVFLVRVDGFVAAPAPAFEQVAPQAEAEWRRRADEDAARRYIERLKRAARIERTG